MIFKRSDYHKSTGLDVKGRALDNHSAHTVDHIQNLILVVTMAYIKRLGGLLIQRIAELEAV